VVERLLRVRKVVGSIPSRDIPKVVKRWYKQLPCLRSALKGECWEIWLVGPVSTYYVTWWGDPVKCLRQERFSVAALLTCLIQVPLQYDCNDFKDTLKPSTNKHVGKSESVHQISVEIGVWYMRM